MLPEESAMLLRAIGGAPISVIFAMLAEGDPTSGTKKLTELTRYSANTVSGALNDLAVVGLAERNGHKNGWALTAKAYRWIRSMPGIDRVVSGYAAPAANPQDLSVEPSNPPDLSVGTGTRQDLNIGPSTNNRFDPDLSSDPTSTDSTPDGTQQLRGTAAQAGAPQRAIPPDPHLRHTLTGAGVYPHVADQLAADPWVTEARIEGWIADLRRQQQRPDNNLRSVPAVLVSNLRAHREPPPVTQPRSDPFTCPTCNCRPCLC